MREEDFIMAIRETPDDDNPRLVYADWLEEQGDVRGEFLRLVVRWKAMSPDDTLCRARIQGLRRQVSTEWVAAVCLRLAEDEVREAVFRSIIGPEGPRGIVFLKVEDSKDPSR